MDNTEVLDTHAVARSLTDAEFTPAQADALTNAIRLAADHGDHATTDQLEAKLAELRADLREEIAGVRSDLREEIAGVRTDIANVEKNLIRRALGIAVVLAIQRLWPAAG